MEKEYGGLLDTRLVFSTFKEYKLRRLIILKLFIKMNTPETYIYQWFIFSRPLLSDKQKEFIWNELNGFIYWEGECKN